MEPYLRTYREIGRLCAAWSYLEARTESILWGILELNDTTGPIITWKLDVRKRWEMILEFAHKKHDYKDIDILKQLNKDIKITARDRNIIVHGLVHARMLVPVGSAVGQTKIVSPPFSTTMQPCWSVFQGEGKGKSFPISTQAVIIVRENIEKIFKRVEDFNEKHQYGRATSASQTVETGWPVPL